MISLSDFETKQQCSILIKFPFSYSFANSNERRSANKTKKLDNNFSLSFDQSTNGQNTTKNLTFPLNTLLSIFPS